MTHEEKIQELDRQLAKASTDSATAKILNMRKTILIWAIEKREDGRKFISEVERSLL